MSNYLENVRIAKLEENEKGQLKQNVRNAFRADFIEELKNVLENAGFSVAITEDGVGIEIPNEELGSIPVVVSATVKDLAYDIAEAHEEYMEKQAEKVRKAEEAERLKAQKLAEKEALKASKAKKNAK